jgi:hypothetical protein
MENLSAHKPLSKSRSLTHPHRSFTSRKTLPAAHSLAQFPLAEVAHFPLAPKIKPEIIKIVVSAADSNKNAGWREESLKYGASEIYDKFSYDPKHIVLNFQL